MARLKQGKRYRADVKKVDKDKVYTLTEAVNFIKSFKATKFDQSVEIVMHLGIDDRQADQMIRGSVSLPHGIGQSRRVVAFCPADKIEACKAAGAVEAGGEDLVERVAAGWMDFDVAVATPDMMRVVSKLGRTLGPKGLMPSPKAGTVTPDVATAVAEYAAGKVEFRNDKGGNVHAVVGKMSFDSSKLIENVQSFLNHVIGLKPQTVKGAYVRGVAICGTMSPSVRVVA